jgi:hypothetical protein
MWNTCYARKSFFIQKLKISNMHVMWYKNMDFRLMFRTDYYESELQLFHNLWNDREQRQREVIMCLICF